MDRLEGAEIARWQEFSAYQVVQRLRPNWLRIRGGSGTPGDEGVKVHVDGSRMGGLEVLQSLDARHVLEMRYMNPADATTRWGTGYQHGVIMVTTGG